MATYISTVTVPLAPAFGCEHPMPDELSRWLFTQLVAVRAMRLASISYDSPLDTRANLFSVPISQIGTVLDHDRQPVAVRNLLPAIKSMHARVALTYRYMSMETMLKTCDEGQGLHFFFTVNSGMLEPRLELGGAPSTLRMTSMIFPLSPKADVKRIEHEMNFAPKSNVPISSAAIGVIRFEATVVGDRKQIRDYNWTATLYLTMRRKHKRTTFATLGKRKLRNKGIRVEHAGVPESE